MTISRIYHSREDRIKNLHAEKERVQYDGHDTERVQVVADTVDEYVVKLCDALEEYGEEIEKPADEDSESRMRYARQQVVERWALAQGALSKVAWALRIDGNTAYERMVNAITTDEAMDMRGL